MKRGGGCGKSMQICECLLMYDMRYYPYRRIVIYIVRVCVCVGRADVI